MKSKNKIISVKFSDLEKHIDHNFTAEDAAKELERVRKEFQTYVLNMLIEDGEKENEDV